jgi:glycosyltransferase involved in cell wall biosynthesis
MQAYAALDRLVLRKFDSVAAASEPVAGVLKRWRVAAAPMPNGVEVERFRRAAPILRNQLLQGSDRLVGFVGRLVDGKGGALLLESARAVLAAHPRTAFVFVGEGPCRQEWEALAARLDIARNVLFTGTRNDMPEVYASLDMLVLPSLDEALPMCLLEAMAAGRPVIATPVGSVPRVVLPGVTGLLVRPGDARGLGAAIVALLDDPERGRRLGEQARDHVVQHFSAEAMAAAYLGLYEQAEGRMHRQRRWGLRPS